MFQILAKIFIKDAENIKKPEVRQAYGMLCGWIGIFLNMMLFAGKFIAGHFSNSIAIIADAFNNLSDAGSSFITLIGFRLSGSKPDLKHPFGHGRIEYLSGLCVSVLIVLMAVELLKSSVEKILNPEPVESNLTVILILVASILVKLYMCSYNRKIGKKIASTTMQATATDSLSDSIATFVVLISTLFAKFSEVQIDGYCGVIVGIFILMAGINAAKDTVSPLLGQAPKAEFVDSIKNIVARHSEILGVHDVVVHDYGPGRVMVSLHAEVSAKGDICITHDIISLVENELKKELGCHAVIHMDPICSDDPETIMMKEQMLKKLHEIDPSITMHDFRLVKSSTHTNMVFDVMVPYQFRYSDQQVEEKIQEAAQQIDSHYYAIVEVDKSFIGKQE